MNEHESKVNNAAFVIVLHTIKKKIKKTSGGRLVVGAWWTTYLFNNAKQDPI